MVKVELKRLDSKDLEWARLLHNDPDVLKMLTDPHVVTREEQLSWYRRLRRSRSSQRLIAFVNNQKVGVVRVDQIDSYNKSVCVGLDIHKDHRGKGYAKLIYRAVFKEYFDTHKFNRVWLYVASYNTVARRLYKALGFLEENVQREALYKDGVYHDYIGMSILKGDWCALSSDKTCSKCCNTKSADAFFRLYRRRRVRLQNICKECQTARHREYYARTKNDRRIYKRRSDLKKKYGITLDNYHEMLVAQEFACAICKEPEKYSTSKETKPTLAVDHCHKSSKVRGLLCSQCNQALGKFKDDPELLESALDYLKRNKHE